MIKEIKKAHNNYITNIKYYLDLRNKRDLMMSISRDNNNIKIWNFKNWNLITDIKEIYDSGALNSASFLNNNNEIYILTSNSISNKEEESGQIKIYNLEGNKIDELFDFNIRTFFIDIYNDNKLSKIFIITGNPGYCISYNYNDKKIYHKYIDIDKNYSGHYSLIINSSEEMVKLIESSFDGYIRIWNFHSGLILNKININSGHLYGICLLHNKYLFVGCKDKTIKIIDLKNEKICETLINHNREVICIKVINNYNTLFLLSQGRGKDQIKLWKIE